MEEDDSPNQICLRTHKGEYYQGETVYGLATLLRTCYILSMVQFGRVLELVASLAQQNTVWNVIDMVM